MTALSSQEPGRTEASTPSGTASSSARATAAAASSTVRG
jgi:hypothetical protein